MKKLSIALGMFGLISGLVGVLGNTACNIAYAAQRPDFSAVAQGTNESTGVTAAVAVSRKSRFVVGRGTLKIGSNIFILNVTDATLSTDRVKKVKGQEPIPVTNSALPGLITCSPAFAQLTVEVSPGVTTTEVSPGVTTIQLNECESDNSTLFGTNNPCTGKPFKVDPTGVCNTEFPGKDTIVINKFSLGSNVFCSDTSPCIAPDDIVIFEPQLPVCIATAGEVTCF